MASILFLFAPERDFLFCSYSAYRSQWERDNAQSSSDCSPTKLA